MENRKPEESRQAHHTGIAEELGEVAPHRFRRRRRRRAEVDEEDAAGQCCDNALERSFAVMSTIGMTRSYAIRVGPITPTVPTTSPFTV